MASTDPLESLYQGFAIPLDDSGEGPFRLRGTKDVIRSSIRMILLTRLGERVMLPTFGSRIWEAVGEPNDEVLAQFAKFYTADAVKTWDNRIEITKVEFGKSDDGHGLLLRIHFVYKATQQPDLIVLDIAKELTT